MWLVTGRGHNLQGIRILVPFIDKDSRSTRPDKVLHALLSAGADITVIGAIPTWLIQRFDDSDSIAFLQLPSLGISTYSTHPNRAIRIFLNLTWYKIQSIILPRTLRYGKLLKVCERYKPDVVQGFNPSSLRVAYRISQKTNSRFAYDSAEYWRGFVKHPAWANNAHSAKRILRDQAELLKYADLVTTTSDSMSRKLSEDYDLRKVSTFYNSQEDVGEFSREEVDPPVKFVFHGMIWRDRNILNLVRAMRLLGDCTLDIHGEFDNEDDKKAVLREIDKGLKEQVTLHGHFEKGDIRTFLPRYDVGVYPAVKLDGNFDVTLPNKIFDYTVHGLALAMPPFESIKDLVDQEGNGLTIDTSSVESLAEGLRQFVDSPSMTSKFKTVSRAVAGKYSRSSQEAKLIAAYEEMFDA